MPNKEFYEPVVFTDRNATGVNPGDVIPMGDWLLWKRDDNIVLTRFVAPHTVRDVGNATIKAYSPPPTLKLNSPRAQEVRWDEALVRLYDDENLQLVTKAGSTIVIDKHSDTTAEEIMSCKFYTMGVIPPNTRKPRSKHLRLPMSRATWDVLSNYEKRKVLASEGCDIELCDDPITLDPTITDSIEWADSRMRSCTL